MHVKTGRTVSYSELAAAVFTFDDFGAFKVSSLYYEAASQNVNSGADDHMTI